MNEVNRTLYIPLYGKAFVSRRGLFLKDPTAEELWAAEGFALRGKARSKWLAYSMGIRAAVFDDWTRRQMEAMPDAVILHIGCGLDSRARRVGTAGRCWYDVDFADVIRERKRYDADTAEYHLLAGDVRDSRWLDHIPQSRSAIVVMEGVSMYLTAAQLREFSAALERRFAAVSLLMDAYTPLAARLSRLGNPVRSVGVAQVYGVDDPAQLQSGGLLYVQEHDMTPQRYIDELSGMEKRIFQNLYAGRLARKLYRLFEYRKG